MARRAAICIGVNRAKGMTPLTAAARDAVEFEAWALGQRCETTLLTDGEAGAKVVLSDVFDAVESIVLKGTYSQLIVYFSGHGILLAPGAEYWLLSRGPANPNEAVNLLRSIEDARNSGVPHVVFVSDACRSAADTATLRAVTGGLIFPPQSTPSKRAEIDVYYATLPGDPANEVPQQRATDSHRGLFTHCLLQAVMRPPETLVDSVDDAGVQFSVVSSRRLKDHLESTVPIEAAKVRLDLSQTPDLRVETALPKYFAHVGATRSIAADATATPAPAAPTIEQAFEALRSSVFDGAAAASAAHDLAISSGLAAEIERLASIRSHFESATGFSIHGAAVARTISVAWDADRIPPDGIRLWPSGVSKKPSSIVIQFDAGTAAMLPVLPGFIGIVVVERGRVISVNFVPSAQTWRYTPYARRAAQLNKMKAFAAVASRNGRFEVEREHASQFADRVRQNESIDPMLGLYAAYAYAQVGQYDETYRLFSLMRDEELEVPIPFDVGMLALRSRAALRSKPRLRIAPFAPILSQGWALLMPGDRMHHPIHQRLRPRLVPSLFTTLDAEGVSIVEEAMAAKEVS
jgi:hypothetical protein